MHNEPQINFVPTVKIYDPSKPDFVKFLKEQRPFIKNFKRVKNDKLRVVWDSTRGFSVIVNPDSKTPIKAGEVVCLYSGKRIKEIKEDNFSECYYDNNKPNLRKYPCKDKNLILNYAFLLENSRKKRISTFGHDGGGVAILVNCTWSGHENLKGELVKNEVIQYVAKIDILPGTELLIDYGPDYQDIENFDHYFPIGIRSIEVFLKQTAPDYKYPPIELSEKERELLKTHATHLLLPVCYENINQYSMEIINSLPIIEMIQEEKEKSARPLAEQQFMTSLMYACAKADSKQVEIIIKKKASIVFITKTRQSALYIASKIYQSGKEQTSKEIFYNVAMALKKIYKEMAWDISIYAEYLEKNMDNMTNKNDLILELIKARPNKNKIISPFLNDNPIIVKNTLGVKRKIDKISSQPDPLSLKFDDVFNQASKQMKKLEPVRPISRISFNNSESNELKKTTIQGMNSQGPINKDKNFSDLLMIANIFKEHIKKNNKNFSEPNKIDKPGIEYYSEINKIVEALENDQDPSLQTLFQSILLNNRNLINMPLIDGHYEGMTPIAIAIKKGKLNALRDMHMFLNHSQQFAQFLKFPQPGGEDKGLTAILMAIKYKKPEILLAIINWIGKVSLIPELCGDRQIDPYKGCTNFVAATILGDEKTIPILISGYSETAINMLLTKKQVGGLYKEQTVIDILTQLKKDKILEIIQPKPKPSPIPTDRTQFQFFNRTVSQSRDASLVIELN